MGIHSLKQEFLDHFGIKGFFATEKKGGQKRVYFVERDSGKQVMKLFEGGKDERFDREMEIYERYKSMDGIPKIYGTDEYQGEVVVFEQYIEGHTLSDIVSSFAGDNLKVKALLKDLFYILTPIWTDRYVHRDLKPENIIIRVDGKPVILDFGIARDLSASSITAAGVQPGTWKWAAPEQYDGRKDMISYRTDFFSLGIIAYFLFYQQLPFGHTSQDISDKFKSGDESFQINANCGFANFLIEALKFKPSHRPKSIEDLINLI
ncbi:MAG TPA: protein kinase [Puia sp.]|uniref:serine/threonine protein kinase n=1 Tax=Puia sp. TaxID=2045100 RepID=UPI002B6F2C6F|nr:protein kinase [Puia sp.]HVU97973.1 protein kinase [Puia sp.]